jgi:hypothetical protein
MAMPDRAFPQAGVLKTSLGPRETMHIQRMSARHDERGMAIGRALAIVRRGQPALVDVTQPR